jgi:hypothetical protein
MKAVAATDRLYTTICLSRPVPTLFPAFNRGARLAGSEPGPGAEIRTGGSSAILPRAVLSIQAMIHETPD